MLRIFLAILFSLLCVCLIPVLNKARPKKEISIISYRLKSFEPQKLLEKEKVEEEMMKKELLDQELDVIDDTITDVPIKSPLFDFNFKANMNFSASSISGLQVNKSVGSIRKQKMNILQGGVSIFSPKPKMPLRALQLGLSGKVKARFKINKKGFVEDIKIIESSHRIFNSAVINALKKYKFSPFVDVNGQIVEKIRAREFEFNVK